MNSLDNLMGSSNIHVNEPVTLEPGEFVFPFDFRVPFALLPPSVEVCSYILSYYCCFFFAIKSLITKSFFLAYSFTYK
jgi:hypothetical protein